MGGGTSRGLVLALGLVVAGVVLAGVSLTVENASRSRTQPIEIDFGAGHTRTAVLAPHEAWSKRVGKIGERADFTLILRIQVEHIEPTSTSTSALWE